MFIFGRGSREEKLKCTAHMTHDTHTHDTQPHAHTRTRTRTQCHLVSRVRSLIAAHDDTGGPSNLTHESCRSRTSRHSPTDEWVRGWSTSFSSSRRCHLLPLPAGGVSAVRRVAHSHNSNHRREMTFAVRLLLRVRSLPFAEHRQLHPQLRLVRHTHTHTHHRTRTTAHAHAHVPAHTRSEA